MSGAAEDVLAPFDPDAAYPILSATKLPKEPANLIHDAFAIDLANLSDEMAALVRP